MISKKEIKSFLEANFAACELLIHSATGWIFFISGTGRFRTMALISGLFFLRGVSLLANINSRILTVFFVPLLIVSFFQDITAGQIFPVFTKINPLLSVGTLCVCIYVDTLVTQRLRMIVTVSSDEHLFVICPRCKYDNTALVSQCNSCSFKKENNRNIDEAADCVIPPMVDSALLQEIEANSKRGLFKQPSSKIVRLLALDSNEVILVNIRLFPFISFFKDEGRDIASNLILTSKRCIFIDSALFSDGWRLREYIPYTDVIEVSAYKKHIHVSKEPFLTIKTNNSSYDLRFASFGSYKTKIDGILECLRNRNPKIRITNTLT